VAQDTRPLAALSGRTIGLDLGDRWSRFCVLDVAGEIVQEGRVATTELALRELFGLMPPARIALEVGTHSPWASREIARHGHQVLVAHAARVRLITGHSRKTDRDDAERLARLARSDPKLLSPIEHRSESDQADISVVRSRDALVRSRTLLINHVRGVFKSYGSRAPTCSAPSFEAKVAPTVPEALRTALTPVLAVITDLTARIRRFDREILRLAEERHPAAVHLQSIPGVGPLTSLAYVLTIQDPKRFPRSRTVGAYLGLAPRKHQSGERDPALGIAKTGDRFVRRLLVSAAHYILGPFGPPTDLRRFGLAIAGRGGKGGKRRAVVAVARKLAVLLHHLWLTGEIYDPDRIHRQRSRVLAASA
jgi:transposase